MSEGTGTIRLRKEILCRQCSVVGNRPENDAAMHGEFTVPRAALELNNALNAKVPAARSAGGKRKA